MFKDEEEKLEKWKEEIENASVPQDELEGAIRQGLQRAQQVAKPVKKRPVVKRGVWAVVVAAVLLITFATSIRVSPAFANVVALIPGMEKIVALIQDNKGLQSAIENEYYQPLNQSIEKEGVTLTLDGVIADEQEMIIFYSVKSFNKGEQPLNGHPLITDIEGEDIAIRSSSDALYDIDGKGLENSSKVNVHFREVINKSGFIFKVKLESDSQSIDYEIPFSLDKEKMPTIRYPTNETVSIEGQKITIKQIEISPIKVSVHIRVDPANTKEILGYEDFRLVDGKGETWSAITNGLTASGIDEYERVYYLQSNYFEQAKGLTLMFNKLQAIDKDEAYVVIDTDKGIILEQPADQRFSVIMTNRRFIELFLKGEKGFHSDPFIKIVDMEGKEFHTSGGGFSRLSDEQIQLSVRIPDESYVNPIKLPLYGYPQWIEGDVKIKIK
ncbi:DUF4179 domain-containing protein [Sporosarcina sp. FSL K6-3457]|uniref:DUF4179 domain-containing protein n=1 Tax=Sporosarcina sp. FSL K6-3457 TaxID=2978204 RepID=UPI0030F59A28